MQTSQILEFQIQIPKTKNSIFSLSKDKSRSMSKEKKS
jgi:hypothetical protein